MKIYEVPNERRYWVVRAESGRYYDHFTKHGLIALGHVNGLDLQETVEGDVFCPDEGELNNSFLSYHESKKNKKQRASSQLAQVKAFVYEMSVGDWVMTVGHNSVRFGRIISRSFVKKDVVSVIYDPETGFKVDMNFNLRRQVQWGPTISRKLLPYGLIKSLKANQTVFCLDKNWVAVYHSLYPAFHKDNKLFLSAKINTEENIKNYSVTAIFNLLNEIEIIGKEFALGNSLNNFDDVYTRYIDEDRLSITTKAQFHSPGEIWNTISPLAENINLDTWTTYTVVAYSMLFGNQKLGFDGLIDLETRKKIWDVVIERIRVNKAEKVVESLKLEMPSENTNRLEDSSNDKL
jgi:hypothetical protein